MSLGDAVQGWFIESTDMCAFSLMLVFAVYGGDRAGLTVVALLPIVGALIAINAAAIDSENDDWRNGLHHQLRSPTFSRAVTELTADRQCEPDRAQGCVLGSFSHERIPRHEDDVPTL